MSLRDRLLRGQSTGRVDVGGFLAWWWRSLLAWLPRRWRLALDRGRLLLQPDGDGVRLSVQDADGLRELAPRVPVVDGDATFLPPEYANLPRWLLLPAGLGLRRRLALPAAAAERLRDVVGYEIERQTPFAADAVAFDAHLLDRSGAGGQVVAELVVVPRQALATQLQALGPLAGSLAGIDIADAGGRPSGVNLLDPAQRQRQADPRRNWNRLLAAVALVAAIAAMWQVLDNREHAAELLQARADREAVEARRIALQRQQLIGLVEGRAFLDQRRGAHPAAVEVLDALARGLPDGTYLEKLSLEGDRLLVIGLSSEAPSLVERLEGAGPWRSPALTGALQSDPRSGRDRFTLAAELAVADGKDEEAGRAADAAH